MKRKLFGLIAIMVIAAMVLAGCNTANGDANETGGDGDKPVIELGYVQWACANANSHMLKVLLEEKFDVEVNLSDMDAGLLWQAVSTGDIDVMACAWLPTTHQEYYNKLKDDVVDLGPLYEGAKLGLVVPEYVTLNSIEELNDNAEKFDEQIIGIDAGAGIMKAAAQAIQDYDMTNMELTQSSDAAMTASLKAAYEQEDWIVVTGWSPHWMFSTFNLKFLDDPKMSMGGEETINVVTKKGFADEHPEINAFLDNYSLNTEQYGSLISVMEEYDDHEEGARFWIDENRELVDSWFQ